MNKEKITSVLCELHKISGFRVSLHNTAFEEIASYPEDKLGFCRALHLLSEDEYQQCVDCDRSACKRALEAKNTIIYQCRHGLIEAISPLYNFGALTGFLMMGQIFPGSNEKAMARSVLTDLGKTEKEAEEAIRNIPEIDSDMVSSFVNIMTICASYLTLSNSVTGNKPTIAQLAMRYISENYAERISIRDICAAIGYSKSTVLNAFKNEYSTTINAYLTELRLENAKKLLADNEKTVNEIALYCGFSDQSYFSKVFSAKYGITPTDYRKGEKH